MMTFQELEKVSPANGYYDVRDQLKRHIYGRAKEAFAKGDAARDAVRTRQALARRQALMRRGFIAAVGGLPPIGGPLKSRVAGELRGEGFRIEKVMFESRPKVFVTANLYVPDGVDKPRGAVLFLCGHSEKAKHDLDYQVVCQILAQAGLVVLAQDPIGQGERLSYYEAAIRNTTVRWGTGEHQYAGSQCALVGDSLARYFIHDAMRGVDYLCSRKEVDPRRIGVTGNSGGGTQTCMMMVCDPRVAAAAPATFLMNRETYMWAGGCQDAEQIWPGTTAEGFDHEDILLMMCPKPVCALAVKYDYFPIEGTRRTVERCRRLWGLFGKGDHLRLAEDASTHKYTPNLAVAAAEFFSEHLLGRKVTPRPEKVSPFEPSQLWVTRSGQVRGEMDGARAVFEENLERVKECERARKALPAERRRKAALAWLKKQVFRDRKPCEMNPRFYLTERTENLEAQFCFWWSQEGLFNHGIVFRRFDLAGRNLPVTLAVWDEGTTALRAHGDWVRRTCADGRAVLVLDVSGAGGLKPHPLSIRALEEMYGTYQKFHDDLVWLNDSLAALRTYDVIRALDMIAAWPGLDKRDIQAYAFGRHGLYARLAAALDARIGKIEVAGGLSSYGEFCRSRHYNNWDVSSILLPGVLRYGDLPDLDR
ncbi:MAG TPA: prolyl oligopeptidase family serine peptidase [Candidatus Brocadiia bacterium]|nr:prolyl oligopeptidase family serine peptidase [Candidatus Brocadiia bacterium]